MKIGVLVLCAIETLAAVGMECIPNHVSRYEATQDFQRVTMHAIFSEDVKVLEPVLDEMLRNNLLDETFLNNKSVLQQAIAFQKIQTVKILVEKFNVRIEDEDILFAQEQYTYYQRHREGLINFVLKNDAKSQCAHKLLTPLPAQQIYYCLIKNQDKNKVIYEAFSNS